MTDGPAGAQRDDGAATTVLVVDDEPRVARLVDYVLRTHGFAVSAAPDGPSAIESVRAAEPDLILLDVSMPGIDGFMVCRQIRTFSTVPVIFLTGLSREGDLVEGLAAGADDYVVKPFSAEELLARIRAVLRRVRRERVRDDRAELCVDDGWLRIDLTESTVRRAGQPLRLSRTELRLLIALAENVGRVVPHGELGQLVWGEEYHATNDQLRTYVKYLRRKIEPVPEVPRYLITRPGVGYLFRLPR